MCDQFILSGTEKRKLLSVVVSTTDWWRVLNRVAPMQQFGTQILGYSSSTGINSAVQQSIGKFSSTRKAFCRNEYDNVQSYIDISLVT